MNYINKYLSKINYKTKAGKKRLNTLKLRLKILVCFETFQDLNTKEKIKLISELIGIEEKKIRRQLTWLTDRKYGFRALKKQGIEYLLSKKSDVLNQVREVINDVLFWQERQQEKKSIFFEYIDDEIRDLIFEVSKRNNQGKIINEEKFSLDFSNIEFGIVAEKVDKIIDWNSEEI